MARTMSSRSRQRRETPLRAVRSVRGQDMVGVESTDVSQRLHEYDDSFLECRDLQHSWTRMGYWSEGGHVKRRLACNRCGTTRTDTWSPDGYERIGGRYEYPEGYVIPSGEASTHSARHADIRHEVIYRAELFASEDSMMESLFRPTGSRKRA